MFRFPKLCRCVFSIILSHQGVHGLHTFSLGNQILHSLLKKKTLLKTHGDALASLQTVRYKH